MKYIETLNNKYNIDVSECFWDMTLSIGKNHRISKDSIEHKPGVYIFWGWDDLPIRVGIAEKLRNRIISYWAALPNRRLLESMQNDIQYVSVIYTNENVKTGLKNRQIEWDIIETYKPKYNFAH
jgi:excinuclease UvrABC nuclease subunit